MGDIGAGRESEHVRPHAVLLCDDVLATHEFGAIGLARGNGFDDRVMLTVRVRDDVGVLASVLVTERDRTRRDERHQVAARDEALEQRIACARDEQIVDAYTRMPETDEELEWAGRPDFSSWDELDDDDWSDWE